MEIVYVYSKKRTDFGKPCRFSDRPAELHVDITPDLALLENFIMKNPVNHGIQHVGEMGEHYVNTEKYESENSGMNHVEGGWPKEVNAAEQEQVTRYRKKLEKDDAYISSIKHLSSSMEHAVLQNNAVNIYEEYFAESEEPEVGEPSMNVVCAFRDPNELKRTASHISWYPDAPTKVAVAYSSFEFQRAPNNLSVNSYIWDVESSYKPDMVLRPSSNLCCVEFNPKDSHVLIGGCYNGQIAYWDTRKGSHPIEATPVECSHRDPAYKVLWIQSKTGTEAFSASTDGQVMWWDTRKFSEPVEKMVMDLNRHQDRVKAEGITALEYEPSMPTKFMAATEQGHIVSCNRKAKTPAEKIVAVYPGHVGPVYSLQRNFFYPKIFLSVGDWTARIWTEEVRESSIMWTKYHTHNLTASAWSPVRPGVFFTTKVDGSVDVWDITSKHKDPILSMQVCEEALYTLRVHEHGRLMACGSQNGTVNILQLAEPLRTAQPNEKNAVGAIFERESRREKILEARNREMKLKAKTLKQEGNYGSGTEDEDVVNAGKNREQLVKQAEAEFWKAMDLEKKQREKDGKEREKRERQHQQELSAQPQQESNAQSQQQQQRDAEANGQATQRDESANDRNGNGEPSQHPADEENGQENNEDEEKN